MNHFSVRRRFVPFALLGAVAALAACEDKRVKQLDTGITRDSVITIARDLGIKVVEQMIPREMLYIADEVFFSGTAAEITPIRSVDRITVGDGTAGPITRTLQKEFYGIVQGKQPDRFRWFTAVKVKQPVGV